LLFELLTGEPLFWRPADEDTRELMRRHRVVRPSELNALVIEEVDRIVLAALTRDPNKRVQSAAELGAAIARVRATRYPDATPRALGELVARVAAEAEAEVEAVAELLPSTREVAESARIETFASQPIATVRTPARDARIEAPPPPPPVLPSAPSPPLGRSLIAASFVIAAAAVIVWGVGALAERKEEPAPPIVAPAPDPDLARTATEAEVIVLQATPEPQEPPEKKSGVKKATGALATVSFGTRSCSSRVTIDGVIVARSTPSYDHKITPGEHTISVEGTSCPLIERPGSLKPSLPTVAKRVEVAPGARLKVIADFAREELLVREE
jgi:hypothetical protein